MTTQSGSPDSGLHRAEPDSSGLVVDGTATARALTAGGIEQVEAQAVDVVGMLMRLEPTDGGAAADLAGLLGHVANRITERKRELLAWAQQQDPDGPLPAGGLYSVEDEGSYTQTWRLDLLLTLLGGDEVNGLLTGYRAGLLEVQPRLRQVEAYCREQGLPFLVRTGQQQLAADLNGDHRVPHLIKTWKPRLAAKPIVSGDTLVVKGGNDAEGPAGA